MTTNFDLHFEAAASKLFGSSPETYKAPALPLGYDFKGIVHVHGALTQPENLVLTDADFGRGYLTEGWARRFLADVFRTFNVLFVGYSHNDVVMNYLARALPADSIAGRFALTEEEGSWSLLGIEPIRFTKGTGADAYKELYDGVHQLVERVTRSALDWQKRLAEIGGRIPPVDVEGVSEIEQALREVHTTRFLTHVARHPEWVIWLNERKHLDALFNNNELNKREKLLASWLADHFAIAHADIVFELIAAHGLRMNPLLWWYIGLELCHNKDKHLEEHALKRWITILLASAPNQTNPHVLMWLAHRCANHNAVSLALKVFFKMSEHRLTLKYRLRWHDKQFQKCDRSLDANFSLCSDHYALNEVWIKSLKPHLALVSEPLLSGITHRLANIHDELTSFEKGSSEWDPISLDRSAIEPHEQNRFAKPVDVLIDSARDALEWLATYSPLLFDSWLERLVISDVPLLRRLAIHALTVHPSQSAEDRLNWLLTHVGLHSYAEHHEVYRAVALNYAIAGDAARQAVVDAVLVYQLPAIDNWSAEKRTSRSHFEWLSWLLCAKPDCIIAQNALMPIKDSYPEWKLSEHPDLTYWMGKAEFVESISPWSIEQLQDREPQEQIDDLIEFKGNPFDGPSRDGLLIAIRDVCRSNISWAFDLIEVLIEKSLWQSDLWPSILSGMQEANLSFENWRKLLDICDLSDLQKIQSHAKAKLLNSIIKINDKVLALNLLDQANKIALDLWLAFEDQQDCNAVDDWISKAINHPAGIVVEFWLSGLSLLLNDKDSNDRILPENYRQWFTIVLGDESLKGGLARSLLASQTAFLYVLDEPWTIENIVPLFSETDSLKFRQAWSGFLTCGTLYPSLATVLVPAFINAVDRLTNDLLSKKDNFIKFYINLIVSNCNNQRHNLLPNFFLNTSIDDRINFATELGYLFRQMPCDEIQHLWDDWLHKYWVDRLQGIPHPLDSLEIIAMLEWLPHMGEVYPLASLLAAKAPIVKINHAHMLFKLRESDLAIRYPTETAKLVIYLCQCVIGHEVGYLKDIAARLTQLPLDLRKKLDEALAVVC